MVGGTEVPIEITVTKGSMNGFAKLQLDIPAEFQIKEVDEKGATYTYNEGIAKWVWAALPTESEIVIKLIVIPASDNLGPKTISAKYSYVENNVKQVVEMTPAEINVVSQSDAQEVAAVTEPTTSAEPTTAVVAEPTETPAAVASEPVSTPAVTTPASGNAEPPSPITIKRTVNRISQTEYEVGIRISKGATKGFARYSDALPPDVEVRKSGTDGSSFSVADGKIKFVWANVPEKDTLNISYVISSTRIQVVELKGEYSYLEDNQSKNHTALAMSIAFETPIKQDARPIEEPVTSVPDSSQEPIAKAVETPTQTRPAVAVQESTQVVKTPAPEKKVKTAKTAKPKTTKPAGNSGSTTASASTSAPSPEAVASSNGMIYHVQIGAFTKKTVTASKLEKKFKVTERINSEMAEGYTKFMVGNHIEYRDARDHRETMISTHNIKSSFVVAYNNGKRITVQEALSITNQKWYK